MRLFVVCAVVSLGVLQAQKFAYVNTDYILENMKDFREAQAKLDEYARQWQSELEKMYAEVDRMYREYQAEMVLLTEEMKRKREDEIMRKEKEIKEFQKRKFGVDGELTQKRKELIRPIQEKVYKVISKIASERNLDFVFDIAGNSPLLYYNPKYDLSDDVLKRLGIEVEKEEEKK